MLIQIGRKIDSSNIVFSAIEFDCLFGVACCGLQL